MGGVDGLEKIKTCPTPLLSKKLRPSRSPVTYIGAQSTLSNHIVSWDLTWQYIASYFRAWCSVSQRKWPKNIVIIQLRTALVEIRQRHIPDKLSEIERFSCEDCKQHIFLRSSLVADTVHEIDIIINTPRVLQDNKDVLTNARILPVVEGGMQGLSRICPLAGMSRPCDSKRQPENRTHVHGSSNIQSKWLQLWKAQLSGRFQGGHNIGRMSVSTTREVKSGTIRVSVKCPYACSLPITSPRIDHFLFGLVCIVHESRTLRLSYWVGQGFRQRREIPEALRATYISFFSYWWNIRDCS